MTASNGLEGQKGHERQKGHHCGASKLKGFQGRFLRMPKAMTMPKKDQMIQGWIMAGGPKGAVPRTQRQTPRVIQNARNGTMDTKRRFF